MVEAMRRHGGKILCAILALFVTLVTVPNSVVTAQEAPVMISGPAGQPMNADQAKAMMEAQKAAAAQAGGQPGAQPAAEAKKEGEQKPAEGEKKEEPSTTVKRPEKPPRVPDPQRVQNHRRRAGPRAAVQFHRPALARRDAVARHQSRSPASTGRSCPTTT